MSKKMEKVHESDNELLTEVSNSLILEAISHFNTTRSRLREGDERYFYKWGQAEIKYQTGQNTVCYAQDCLRKRHAC